MLFGVAFFVLHATFYKQKTPVVSSNNSRDQLPQTSNQAPLAVYDKTFIETPELPVRFYRILRRFLPLKK